jgi:hypothetical protein
MPRRATPLPTHEIDLLCNTVTRALELAGLGYPAHGYWELVYGRERTRLDLGEAWGPELLARWEHAVTEYVRRHSPVN